MINIFKHYILGFSFIFISFSSIAQTNNNNLKIKAEKVKEGIKITTIKNGKESSTVFNYKDAQKYLENHVDDLDINIEENGNNNYQISYSTENGTTETIEIDFEDIAKDFSSYLDEMEINLNELIDKVNSTIEYEEIIDKDGNKTYKIKSVK